MTSRVEWLRDLQNNFAPITSANHLNGQSAHVSRIGSCVLGFDQTFRDVLLVLNFIFNIIFVSKLVWYLACFIVFYHCVIFQDIISGRVNGIDW